MNETGSRYKFECYDTSRLHTLPHFWSEELVKAPLFTQTCFELLGGIGAHPEEVLHMKPTADRLFGDDYRWSVLGAGRGHALTFFPESSGLYRMIGRRLPSAASGIWQTDPKIAEAFVAHHMKRVR